MGTAIAPRPLMLRPIEIIAGAATLIALSGQASAQGSYDELGPARCAALTARTTDLPSQQMLALCTGASGDAPARCFQDALGRLGLSPEQGVALCAQATSSEPESCAQHLSDTTALERSSIVGYCSAQRSSPSSPPQTQPGSVSCVRSAQDRTSLPAQQVFDLCLGAPSAAPAACYAWGAQHLALSSEQLVELCAPYTRAQ